MKFIHKYLILSFIISLFINIKPVYSQIYSVHYFDSLFVTGSRIPVSSSESNRNIINLDQKKVTTNNPTSLEEILETVTGIDITSRGPFGVQSDIIIRGASFEQNLILLDGIKMTNPQTGHHNLNFPVINSNIERIEIVKGAGSKIHGPNAFGGVVNIITKKKTPLAIFLKSETGSHNLINNEMNLSIPFAMVSNNFTISSKKSDGYRHNTDFDIFSLNYNMLFNNKYGDLNLSTGGQNKKFGANSFYSDSYLDQWEETKSFFINSAINIPTRKGEISGNCSFRKYTDRYILIKHKPEIYENFHTVKVLSGNIQSTFETKIADLNIGGEISLDSINSNNLGLRKRKSGGLFFEAQLKPVKNVSAIFGISSYFYSGQGQQLFPGLDIGFQATENLRLYSSIGRAFRIPTYTELYYVGRTNKGNPGLEPENAWSYELGLNWFKNKFSVKTSIFLRKAQNLIDWAYSEQLELWQTSNIARLKTFGYELSTTVDLENKNFLFPITNIDFNYSYLNNTDAVNYTSKYLLNSLRHQINVSLSHKFFARIIGRWNIRYEDREFDSPHTIVDVHSSRRFKNIKISGSISNIFEAEYSEFIGVPLPGRWFRGGLELYFKK